MIINDLELLATGRRSDLKTYNDLELLIMGRRPDLKT